jgi:hypothetical protein
MQAAGNRRAWVGASPPLRRLQTRTAGTSTGPRPRRKGITGFWRCLDAGEGRERRSQRKRSSVPESAERVGHTDGGALILKRYRQLYPSGSYAAAPSLDALVAERKGQIVQIEFLIGGQRHVLGENDARWLEERIRATCVDSSHRPVDADALECLQLADLLSDDLENDATEPIELDPSLVRGLSEHVLAESPEYDHEIQALNVALLRFRAENDF